MEAKNESTGTASTNLKVSNKLVAGAVALAIGTPLAAGGGAYYAATANSPQAIEVPAEVATETRRGDPLAVELSKDVLQTKTTVVTQESAITSLEQTTTGLREDIDHIKGSLNQVPEGVQSEIARIDGTIAGIQATISKNDTILKKTVGQADTTMKRVKKLESRTGVFGRFFNTKPMKKPKKVK